MSKKKTEFDKLSAQEQRMVFHANGLLWLWRELVRQDVDGLGWHERTARLAYGDSLRSLKDYGFIENYDVVEVRTKINGRWYSDRRQYEFVPKVKDKT